MTWNIGNLNKGKHLTISAREKISLKKKQQYKDGKLKLPNNKGNIPWNKGIPRTTEEKQTMSKAHKRNYANGLKPWNKGRKWTIEEKEKFKRGALNMWESRIFTESHKNAIRKANKKRWSEWRIKNAKV